MYHIYKITFVEGKQAIWITDQCPDIESALLGALEKFGKKRVKHVQKNSQEVKVVPPLAPVDFGVI